ncbi:MAG: pilus assembly protein TadG-related protein [Beijerinckiaceae bacterium]
MVFSLSIIPVMMMGGAAMDLSRAVREKTELQAAVDSAVLAAARKMKTGTTEQLTQIATAHLTASQYAPNYSLASAPVPEENKTKLCLTGKASMPTAMMKLVKVDYIDLEATSCAKIGGTTYEVAIALDNTGSMDDDTSVTTGSGRNQTTIKSTKLLDMKKAAKDLIDQLVPASASTYYTKVSLIPFSSAVKAFDPDLIAASGDTDESTRYQGLTWLDNDGNSSIHWQNFPKVTGGSFNPVNRFELHKNINTKWSGCFEARPGSYGLSDAAASTTNPDSLYVPLFAPDEGDQDGSTNSKGKWSSDATNNYLSDYGNSICENNDAYATKDSNTYWGDGMSKLCKYKPGVQITTTPGACTNVTTCEGASLQNNSLRKLASYTGKRTSSGFAGLPSIGIDYRSLIQKAAQTCGWVKKNGKWKWKCEDDPDEPVCTTTQVCEPEVVTTENLTITATNTTSKGPNFSCETRPVTQLSTDNSLLKNEIEAMDALGSTNIISGFMWAWKTISPNSPYANFKEIKPYTEPNHQKIIILMTDGDNTWSSTDGNNKSKYGPFGYYWNNRLGSAGGSIGNVDKDNVTSYMNAKTLEACTAAKTAGVKVFTVAFGKSISNSAKTMLESCATSTSNYYAAEDATQLAAAFSDIGDSLQGLHLSR